MCSRPVGLCLLACLLGCVEELDTTRVESARGTLGEEIYEVVCQRIASEESPEDVSGRQSRAVCAGEAGPEAATTPRLRALAENRDRLVPALDRVMPEELEDDVGDFMLSLLPFYEPPDDRLPRQTRAVARVLEELVNDEEALAALERMSTRRGYRPLRLGLGVARPMLAYPEFDSFAERALETIDDGGSAGAEWEALLRASALEMATAQPDPPDETTTLALARQLLYSEDADFAVSAPLWTSRRDARGIVLTARSGGSVDLPFTDGDGDGLADVDALGRFVDATGSVLDVPAPFRVAHENAIARDTMGRALRTDGGHYYAYFDVSRTMLGGVTHEASAWFDPAAPVLMDLTDGLPLLLGPRTGLSREYGSATLAYMGPDTSRGALFDVLHGVGVLLPRESTDDALALVEILVTDHPELLAALIETGLFTDRRADERSAALRAPSNLWDDLIQIATWIAQEPGLMEGLLRSFVHPDAACLGPIYAEMMRYRDDVYYDPGNLNARRTNVVFTERVDRTAPDSTGNMSLFTRSLSVIHDLSGVKMCNKAGAYLDMPGPLRWPVTGSYAECELLEVNDVAQLYAQSIIGRAELELKDPTLNDLLDLASGIVDRDQLLEDMSGIDGLTTHPTPYALNRLVFAPRNDFLENITDPPLSRDGVPVEDRHAGVIFAWEREYFCDGRRVSFYDAMAPLLRAFDDFDRRTVGPGIAPDPDPTNPRFLFGELISAQHLHWSTPASDHTQSTDPRGSFFSYQDGGVTYEENVADAFAEGKLISRLHELSVVLDGIELRPGVDGISVLAAATEDLLDPDRNVGLAARDGRRTTTVNDGSREVPLTPLYLLLDGLAAMDAAFAAEPDRHERWLRARGALVDQLLTVRCTGECEMDNRRTFALVRVLLPFLRERIAAHRDAGDLDAWALSMHERAAESIGSPTGSALIYFLDAVHQDPEAREALAALLGYLVDAASGNDAFPTTLVAIADILQLLEDDLNLVPLLRVLSRALAPEAPDAVAGSVGEVVLDGSAADETMDLLREIQVVDERRTMKAMMANMVALPPGEEETPLEVILDVIAEVNRRDPGAGSPMTLEDHHDTLSRAHDFLTSESRGMERLYRVIQQRELE